MHRVATTLRPLARHAQSGMASRSAQQAAATVLKRQASGAARALQQMDRAAAMAAKKAEMFAHADLARRNSVPKAAQMLDGAKVAEEWTGEIAARVKALKEKHGRSPCLAVVLPNNSPGSRLYAQRKIQAWQKLGIETRLVAVEREDQMLAEIAALNADAGVSGILLERPLPAGWDSARANQAIAPAKDVDCVHPSFLGKLQLGQLDNAGANSGLTTGPCTPRGVLHLLHRYSIDLVGRKAVVVGRSVVAGTPLAATLTRRLATVTLCDRHTPNLASLVGDADLVFVCAGAPELVRGEWLKPGAVVVDVGTNVVPVASATPGEPPKRKVVGGVHFESAVQTAAYLTPALGGVGPMTIAAGLDNTVALFEQQLAASA